MKKQYEEAIQCFNQILENEITYHRAWYYKAEAYEDQKDYLNAFENYKQSIFYSGDDFYTFEKMGIVLRELGRYDEALKYFDRVVELLPLYEHHIHYLRATVFFELGEFDTALSYVEESLDINFHDEEVKQFKEKLLESKTI